MDEVRKKAIEAAALALLERRALRKDATRAQRRANRETTDIVISVFETAMLEGGMKMCPREATDDMVRREAARMSAPLEYMKRKWAAIWDAAPGVNGEHQ